MENIHTDVKVQKVKRVAVIFLVQLKCTVKQSLNNSRLLSTQLRISLIATRSHFTLFFLAISHFTWQAYTWKAYVLNSFPFPFSC